MKVICDAPGQTCNRIWSYISPIAESIVKRKKMIILFYDYTILDFPYLRKSKLIYFPLYQPWYLNRGNGWNNYKGLSWKATHNPRIDKLFQFLGFIKGWNTRKDTEYIAKAKKEIIKIFTPREEIIKETHSLFEKIRSENDLVIGLHVRQGDYKTWHDGRFYYTLSEYHEIMKRISNLYSEKKIAFFISSNESFGLHIFQGFQCYRLHNPISVISDVYSLALCDLIAGPPSTFSRWASFYGEKPICFIYSADQKFSKENFSPFIDFFNFANGKEVYDW